MPTVSQNADLDFLSTSRISNLPDPTSAQHAATKAYVDAHTFATLIANRAIISNGSGAPSASATTATEVGYLSGVTSGIQAQINAKQPAITTAAFSGLPSSPGAVSQYLLTDVNRGIWYYNTNASQWIAANGRIFNVRDYGAVGDGSTDDAAAIQAAHDAASANDVLYFPPTSSSYRMRSMVTISKAMTLKGDRTKILFDFPATTTSANGRLFKINSSNVRFDGLWIDGSGVTATLTGGARYAILGNGSASSVLSNISVTNCRFTNLTAYSGTIPATTNVNHAIYMSYVDNATITHNFFDTLSGSAVIFSGCTNSVMAFMRANCCGWYAFHTDHDNRNIAMDHLAVTGNTAALPCYWGGGIDVMSQNSNGRYVTDGAISASGTTLTSATIGFLATDQYAYISIAGAGAGGADLRATIASVTNSTTVELDTAASTTVTNAAVNIAGLPDRSIKITNCYLSGVYKYGSALRVSGQDVVVDNVTFDQCEVADTNDTASISYPAYSKLIFVITRDVSVSGLKSTSGVVKNVKITNCVAIPKGTNNTFINAINGSGTGGSIVPGVGLVIANNTALGLDASNNFSSGVALQGQAGGWQKVSITGNHFSGKPYYDATFQQVRGLIGSTASTGKPLYSISIVDNRLEYFDGASGSGVVGDGSGIHSGIYFDEYADGGTISGNRIKGFYYGIFAKDQATTQSEGWRNVWDNTFIGITGSNISIATASPILFGLPTSLLQTSRASTSTSYVRVDGVGVGVDASATYPLRVYVSNSGGDTAIRVENPSNTVSARALFQAVADTASFQLIANSTANGAEVTIRSAGCSNLNFLQASNAPITFYTNNVQQAQLTAAGALVLGVASTRTAQLTFANASSAYTFTLQSGVNVTASRVYTWPTDFGSAGAVLTDAAGNGTLSWTLITSVAANKALSNLASVSINASLIPQTGLDLGAPATPWRNLYLFGTGTFGTNSFKFHGTPTGNRTITFFDADDTVVGKATTDTLTNKTFDTAGEGNVFKIKGTTISATTGSGSVVLATSPTLTTPSLGVATATSINKVAVTAPATSATLTIADGKTLTVNKSLTFDGTDLTTMTFPTTSATIARTDSAQTFSGIQTFSAGVRADGYLGIGAAGTNVNVIRASVAQATDTTIRIDNGSSASASRAVFQAVSDVASLSFSAANSTDGSLITLRGAGGGLMYLLQAGNNALVFSSNNTERARFASTGELLFGNNTGDTGIARNAAGVMEINNGTAGTWRDLKLRNIVITTKQQNLTTSTGAGSALLGSNSPAGTLTAPFEWINVLCSDGATGYIPVWK